MTTNHKKNLAPLDASDTGNCVKLARVLSIAKSVSHLVAETPAQQRRAQRYKLQRAAAKLLPGSRTAQCLWAVSSSYGVDIIANKPEGRARFTGLQTCGSVWACPCCSGTVSEQRRVELNTLLAWARAQGLHPVMLTLTARHDKDTQLRAQLDGMKNAKRRMVSNRTFVNLRPHLVGYVTATELTGGGFFGWHPHFHQIMLLKAASQEDALAKVERLRGSWLSSLRAEGLDGEGAAFHLQGASAAGNYVGKWGAAEELTLGAAKQGRKGKTPFQLLSSFSDDGDDRAGSLFAEYAKVFKGRRQLVWSPGLKKLARIEEVSDEQAAEDAVRLFEESKNDERVGHFTPDAWKKVRHVRAALLKFAELSGEAGVSAVVQAATGRPALPLPSWELGMGNAHESEAKPTAVDEVQMHDAVHDVGTLAISIARHDKQGIGAFPGCAASLRRNRRGIELKRPLGTF